MQTLSYNMLWSRSPNILRELKKLVEADVVLSGYFCIWVDVKLQMKIPWEFRQVFGCKSVFTPGFNRSHYLLPVDLEGTFGSSGQCFSWEFKGKWDNDHASYPGALKSSKWEIWVNKWTLVLLFIP